MFAASWMTCQGVSSFSSYSAATGRIDVLREVVDPLLDLSWSSLRSRQKSAIGPSLRRRSADPEVTGW